METGAIQRTAAAANAAPVRSDLTPVRSSAALDPQPVRAPQPTGEVPAVQLDVTDGGKRLAEVQAQMQRIVERRTRIEQTTRDVVVTWVDGASGEVVHQYPDEQTLKMRVYRHERVREALSALGQGRSVDQVA